MLDYERSIKLAEETFQTYPLYSYSVMASYLQAFNNAGYAGTFFTETEDLGLGCSSRREL